MDLVPRRNSYAANALQIFHASMHSSTEAITELQQYINHLEELLTAELGAQEFTRRLESLQSRDSDSLFIPEDNPRPRKRSGSASTGNDSSPKKSRSNSLASPLSLATNLNRSISDNLPRVAQDGVPTSDVYPKTSRKRSLTEAAGAFDQHATPQQMATRSIHPRPQVRRASQSAMLPNIQPSSNFHSKPISPLTKPSQGLAAPQRPQMASSKRKGSLLPDGVSKTTSNASMSPGHNTVAKAGPCSQSFSKPMTHKLPKKPAFSAAQFTSSTNKPQSPANKPSPPLTKLSSSASKCSSSPTKVSASPSTKMTSSADE